MLLRFLNSDKKKMSTPVSAKRIMEIRGCSMFLVTKVSSLFKHDNDKHFQFVSHVRVDGTRAKKRVCNTCFSACLQFLTSVFISPQG